MKLKSKSTNPIEFTFTVQDADFDKVKEWLFKTIGFVDLNGQVDSKYEIELSIKESLNNKPTELKK